MPLSSHLSTRGADIAVFKLKDHDDSSSGIFTAHGHRHAAYDDETDRTPMRAIVLQTSA